MLRFGCACFYEGVSRGLLLNSQRGRVHHAPNHTHSLLLANQPVGSCLAAKVMHHRHNVGPFGCCCFTCQAFHLDVWRGRPVCAQGAPASSPGIACMCSKGGSGMVLCRNCCVDATLLCCMAAVSVAWHGAVIAADSMPWCVGMLSGGASEDWFSGRCMCSVL